jgi:hypothetical protein
MTDWRRGYMAGLTRAIQELAGKSSDDAAAELRKLLREQQAAFEKSALEPDSIFFETWYQNR